MGHPAEKYDEHYTVAQWERWNDRWELIGGLPYAMTPMPNYFHQNINLLILLQLKSSLDKCNKCIAVMPMDWIIDEDTVVQPDVSVLCNSYIPENRITKTPIAIFEILSPSTSKRDRTVKFDLYEKTGVKYYIIVDPEDRKTEVYLLTELPGLKLESQSAAKKYELQNSKENYLFEFDGCKVDFDTSKIFS